MKAILYQKSHKNQWDQFVTQCNSPHFIFYRDFMEYHQQKFHDHSLLFYDKNNHLIALLPANRVENILYSHQGLTFGGILLRSNTRTYQVLEIFDTLKAYLFSLGISKLIYKCIPYIYHLSPSEEDRYALFINNAKLAQRNTTSTIDLTKPIKYNKRRNRSIKKSKKESFKIEESSTLENYWTLLTTTLAQQYNTKPTHTLNEITLLKNRFPYNIRLFTIHYKNDLLAGALVFENKHIIHTQYLANSPVGREKFALDRLLDYLITDVYKDKHYFDFGISNEQNGRILNKGLIAYKEGFGARTFVHDIYEMEI